MRVDDVVYLDELLGAGRENELLAESDVFEAVHIAFVDVGGWRAVDDPLRSGLGHASRVRAPDRLGDPESAQFAVLAHDRHAVGRKGEEPVEDLLNLRNG